MTSTVENLKKEISECYIKDLKKELWWFKSIAILPIQTPIKDILVWKKELPEKFDDVEEFWWWKNIINFVSPNVSNQIFEFMKTKRLEIEKRKTESELIQLKNQILWLESPEENVSQNSDNTAEKQTENWSTVNWNENQENSDSKSDLQEQESQASQTSDSQLPEWTNSVVAWVEASVIWWASTLAIQKISKKIDNAKIVEQLDATKMKSTINGAIETMEKQKDIMNKSGRLTTKQLKTVDNHIAKLKSGMWNIDWEAIDVLKEWNKIWNKLSLPNSLLENCWLTSKQLSKISNVADNLVGKSEDEIKAILHSHGITAIDDNIVKSLTKAENASEIKAMTKVLKHWSKTNRILQTVAWALRIDVAFLWLDVWMYIEQRKEAELISKINKLRWENKYEQAKRQLGIWISSVALEALWILALYATTWSAWGPIGAGIWLVVWALTMAVSFWVDSLYFDVKDFYLQNQEDFLRQKRSQLKQAILQWIHNKKWDVSINEKVTTFLSPSMKPWSEKKEKSLQDACVSMIFLEEIDDNGEFAYNTKLREYVESGKTKEDFLSDKDQNYKNEFEQIWKEMETRINLRMQYISKEFEKSDIIESIKSWLWMQGLTSLFTRSKVFADLQTQWKWNQSQSFEKNLQNYKSELLSDFTADKVQKFENLKVNNPSLFQEIITTVSLEAFDSWDEEWIWEEDKDENYTQNVKMVVAYKKRLTLNENIEDKKYLYIDDNQKNVKFIENLLKVDFNLEKVEYPTLTSQGIIDLVGSNIEKRWLMEISDDPLQNVLYRLARELFWYSKENEIQSLMNFFSESNDDNHWVYYSSKWKINNDWAIDSKLKNIIPDSFHDEDVDRIVSKFMSDNFCWSVFFYKDSIDTPTESIDDNLNKEFRNKILTILKDELSHRTEENQNKIKNQILSFVKKHSRGEYTELPYFLIIEAKRAGLGDLQRQYFKRNNNKLEICYLPSEVNQTSIFADAEKSYISPARESFTQEEQYYIDRVEVALTKLEKLRSKQWSSIFGSARFEDDLDLPTELEHLISDKSKDWDRFKQNMLMYNENVSTGSNIYNKYEEFATYFENLYRGILISLSWFKTSNDIDDFALFSQSLSYWNQDLFDESWRFLSIEWNKLLKDSEFKTFYNEQISKLKIWEKTIKQLRESKSSDEKDLAKQASNLIYTIALETCLLDINWAGNVNKISIWSSSYYEPNDSINYTPNDYATNARTIMDKRKFQKKYIVETLKKRFEKMQVAPTIDVDKIKNQFKTQKINKLNKKQKETTDVTPQIQKQIENTMKNIDWRYKRWDLKFDPETSTLKSRKKQTKIIFPGSWLANTIKLDWLDLNLSLKEWLRLANFRNRVKFNYPNWKVEFGKDLWNRNFSFRKTFKVDGTMLIARWDLVDKYCSICKEDSVMEKITEWLNK